MMDFWDGFAIGFLAAALPALWIWTGHLIRTVELDSFWRNGPG